MRFVPVDYIPSISWAKFEGRLCPVPRSAEPCFTAMYGDWRSISALEDRHAHLPLLIDFDDGQIWESDN